MVKNILFYLKIYLICENKNYLNKEILANIYQKDSLLNMPSISKKEIGGLVKTFVLYARLPRSYWKDIKIAEQNNTKGKEMYNKLKDEFIKKYWDGELSFEESAASNDPHSALLM